MAAPSRKRGSSQSAHDNPKVGYAQTEIPVPAEQPAAASGGGRRRLNPAQAKRIALYGGIVLLAVLAVLAWKQPPRPKNHYPQWSFTGALSWFFYPYEVNPWYRPPVPGYSTRSIIVVPGTDGKALVAVGAWGKVLRTADRGEHWTASTVPDSEEDPNELYLSSVSFADPNRGWTLGRRRTDDGRTTGNRAFTTFDGGATWSQLPDPSVVPLGNATFLDGKTGWASIAGTLSATSDGGASWNSKSKSIQSAVNAHFRTNLLSGDLTSALSFYDPDHGCAAVSLLGRKPQDNEQGIICTADAGARWEWTADSSLRLSGMTFATTEYGWAVGDGGTVLRSGNSGGSWSPVTIGTSENLNGVVFYGANLGWIVGDHGTILHTTDGGLAWKPQESAPYRRYPAPWFFLAMVLFIPLFAWATAWKRLEQKTLVDDIVSADAPVENLEDDRLGQRALVERLTNFLTNQNTAPPLVISLQAPWGMGKSSVMRMLQANLVKNHSAVTVWFNAWHHQKEDQLLAYLLETVQRQAVPQWLSRAGPSFRLDLLRVRLFDKSRRDRLALVLAVIAFVAVRVAFPQLFEWKGGGWATLFGSLLAAGAFLRLIKAFRSNPEKLTDNAGGFLVDTFKEAVRLPSLIGKSDVREEFAENLKDVAEALKPQRLVIFLDDLDRCRPEQVVQILEAINFLSSVAPVFVIVGADYAKVETLVANQFADLAIREEENKAAGNGKDNEGAKPNLDPVKIRVDYARYYLKKIVNIRLNLKAPDAENFGDMMGRPRVVRAEPTMFVRYGSVLAVLAAPAIIAVVAMSLTLAWSNRELAGFLSQKQVNPVATTKIANPAARTGPADRSGDSPNQGKIGGLTPDGNGDGSNPAKRVAATPDGSDYGTPDGRGDGRPEPNGRLWRNGLLLGIPALLALLALAARLARPANLEQAQDDPKFKDALVHHKDAIFKLYRSPREVRRLLNYLRLVAARTAEAETDKSQQLRDTVKDFDEMLVGLAVRDPKAESASSKIREYYDKQCEVFGLDPATFEPMENVKIVPQMEPSHAANLTQHADVNGKGPSGKPESEPVAAM